MKIQKLVIMQKQVKENLEPPALRQVLTKTGAKLMALGAFKESHFISYDSLYYRLLRAIRI